jgi:lauroyl/myristoyl acyltransferase
VASAAQRKYALANYARVLSLDVQHPEVARVARRAFQNYGRMLADFILMGSLQPVDLERRTSYEGREQLDEALKAGRGAIMAVPHMGSWDVAGSLAGVLGYPIYAVAAGFPGSLEDAVVTTRQRFGLKVIPLGRSAVRQLLAALKSNAVVALLCDLPHGPGIEVEFFGRPAVVPGGPASLALKTGARLIPACQWRTGPGRYHVFMDKALDLGEDDARGLMQRVVRRFEDFIRQRPDQWYAFRPLFQT